MDVLVPLTVAIPLLTGAVLFMSGQLLKGGADDLIAIAAAAATLVVSILLVIRSNEHDVVYWFGGWKPRDGVALGVSFTVDPAAAAFAALAGALVLASLIFSWRYFDEVGKLFPVLMLVFLAGMSGFALSGDLFNLFVWFEVMSVAAYALTGYRVERPGPLQGAINFAVTNSVGSFCILFGIGFLYARTGALNLDQIGEALAGHPADGLVIVAFTLIVAGFLTKAGAVPFHFWLSDAYAVAPLPVCVVFAGVMSDLGLHAISRLYWSSFSGTLEAGDLRPVLVGVGLVTALVGGFMCFLERDLKRLLAFVTISNIGVVLVGIALLTRRGLAGTLVYLNTNGLLRGALFLAVGILVRRLKCGDELELRGQGLRAPFAAAVFVAVGLSLALLPPFGPFLGNALVVDSADRLGYTWVPPLLALATIMSAGTILRASARIFGGWGDTDDPLLTQEPEEIQEEPADTARVSPPLLWVPPVALAVCGLGLAFVPDLGGRALQHAGRMLDHAARAREVLHGVRPPSEARPSYSPSSAAYAYGAASTVGALCFAAFGLYRRRLPAAVRSAGGRVFGEPIKVFKALHSGVVADYVTWLVVGVAVLGGLFTVVVR
jgi:multicomponent Na+:H+ antiporter subunit D